MIKMVEIGDKKMDYRKARKLMIDESGQWKQDFKKFDFLYISQRKEEQDGYNIVFNLCKTFKKRHLYFYFGQGGVFLDIRYFRHREDKFLISKEEIEEDMNFINEFMKWVNEHIDEWLFTPVKYVDYSDGRWYCSQEDEW